MFPMVDKLNPPMRFCPAVWLILPLPAYRLSTPCVDDNIANMSWSYFFGRGGEDYDTAYSSRNHLRNNIYLIPAQR